MSNGASTIERSRWPHRVAVVLACATFPLVWVGGLVTTTDAGMAVPDWPTTYGYNLFLYPWQTWLFGPWDLFIEHGHRLLAAGVGLVTMALAVLLWRHEKRLWVRWLGLFAVALVITQGVLGGLRVILDARSLALVHACTGPVFFALSTTLAVVTSGAWIPGTTTRTSAGSKLQTLSLLTAALIYAQLVLGAFLRHVPVHTDPGVFAVIVKFHLFMAAAILLHVAAILWQVLRSHRHVAVLRNLALLATMLVIVEVALGACTWAVKYSVAHFADTGSWLAGYTIQAEGWLQTHVITAHVAVGSLLFVTMVALALKSSRLTAVRSWALLSVSGGMRAEVAG